MKLNHGVVWPLRVSVVSRSFVQDEPLQKIVHGTDHEPTHTQKMFVVNNSVYAAVEYDTIRQLSK